MARYTTGQGVAARDAYREGYQAARTGGNRDKYQRCPHGFGALRAHWLAGWNDRLIERGDK